MNLPGHMRAFRFPYGLQVSSQLPESFMRLLQFFFCNQSFANVVCQDKLRGFTLIQNVMRNDIYLNPTASFFQMCPNASAINALRQPVNDFSQWLNLFFRSYIF